MGKKKKIELNDIQPLKDTFKVPEGYFDSLAEKIEARKDQKDPYIRIGDIEPVQETFKIPEGYFDGLMERIEDRKDQEDNVVSFRKKRIRIWGAFVAAACIAMVVLSVVDFGNETITPPDKTADNRIKNISDTEIASLLNERDDEFELTEEEIIEVIQHETKEDETTAIIDFLEEDAGDEEEDFLESI